MRYQIIISLALLLLSNPAFSLNKCSLNGKVTYTDRPCTNEAHSTAFTKQVTPPNDPEAAQERYFTDKEKLHQLEQQRTKIEKQQKKDEQAQAIQIKRARQREFNCKELEIKRKLARQRYSEVQIRGNSYAVEKARLRVMQANNRLEHYCGS